MKKIALTVLCATAPLAAQSWEAGVFLGQQSYRSVDAPNGSTKAVRQTVVGARLGYSIVDIGPALFQVTAGFQPKSEADVEIDGEKVPGVAYTHQHYSVGAMFNFKAMVAVGAGIEYRFEKVGAEGNGQRQDTNYARPWLRANVGYAFPSPILKPFVGLEVAVPITRETPSIAEIKADVDKGYRGMAPTFQIGVYGGIRF